MSSAVGGSETSRSANSAMRLYAATEPARTVIHRPWSSPSKMMRYILRATTKPPVSVSGIGSGPGRNGAVGEHARRRPGQRAILAAGKRVVGEQAFVGQGVARDDDAHGAR